MRAAWGNSVDVLLGQPRMSALNASTSLFVACLETIFLVYDVLGDANATLVVLKVVFVDDAIVGKKDVAFVVEAELPLKVLIKLLFELLILKLEKLLFRQVIQVNVLAF